LRCGVETGAPQDPFSTEDVGAALLERVVGGQVPNQEHHDDGRKNDPNADNDAERPATRQRPANTTPLASMR
jgi:hypothetical protein